VFNVGVLEIAVIAVLGLLFFGPEKLPKAIQSLVVGIRSLRKMANEASSSLQGAAGLDTSAAKQTMSDLADLHPKRWASGLLDEPKETGGNARPEVSGSPKSDSSGEAVQKRETSAPSADLDPDLP
jgi:sec-independent protein translocase protein TatB